MPMAGPSVCGSVAAYALIMCPRQHDWVTQLAASECGAGSEPRLPPEGAGEPREVVLFFVLTALLRCNSHTRQSIHFKWAVRRC